MIEKVLDLARTKVANADMTGFAVLNKACHSAPCVAIVNILATEVALGNRPMHVVEIKIFKTEFSQRLFDGIIHSVRVVTVLLLALHPMLEFGERLRLTGRSIACS